MKQQRKFIMEEAPEDTSVYLEGKPGIKEELPKGEEKIFSFFSGGQEGETDGQKK